MTNQLVPFDFTSRRRKEILGSSLVFVILLVTLTALRVWNVEPTTSVQSDIVKGAALLCIVGVAYYIFHGGDFIGGWTLALGPSLAFTVNLFVPVIDEVTLPVVMIPLISAAAISGAIAVIGYLFCEVITFVGVLDLKSVWIFVTINVLVWIVISGLLEIFFFNGQLVRSLPTSIAGGIASGLVLFYMKNHPVAESHSR